MCLFINLALPSWLMTDDPANIRAKVPKGHVFAYLGHISVFSCASQLVLLPTIRIPLLVLQHALMNNLSVSLFLLHAGSFQCFDILNRIGDIMQHRC